MRHEREDGEDSPLGRRALFLAFSFLLGGFFCVACLPVRSVQDAKSCRKEEG